MGRVVVGTAHAQGCRHCVYGLEYPPKGVCA